MPGSGSGIDCHTEVSDGSSVLPSSGAPAAVVNKNRDRQLQISAMLLWPGHTELAAVTDSRVLQDHPGGDFHQVGCLEHRWKTVITEVHRNAHNAPFFFFSYSSRYFTYTPSLLFCLIFFSDTGLLCVVLTALELDLETRLASHS